MCHKFMAHPLFSFLRSFFHRISRMNRRHSCLSDYSRIFADIWPLANGWRPKYSLIVFVTQISQMTQIFLRGSFFCPTDFADIHRFFMESLVNLFVSLRGYLQRPDRLHPRKSVSNRRSWKSPNKFCVIR